VLVYGSACRAKAKGKCHAGGKRFLYQKAPEVR
jgi:hypothetical protein